MKPKAALEFVESSAWARVLNAEQLDRVLGEVGQRSVRRGTSVCHAGSPVLYWKGVIDGLIKMSVTSPDGRTCTLTGLAPGAWFGEGPVLRAATWDFDGMAIHDTRLALVPRATFHWLLEVSPRFNRFVIDQLNERLAQFLAVIEAERLEPAETRVARCLAWLFNSVLYPGVGARLALTQEEIGYLCGVSRQRVNRALHMLEQAGVLAVEYGAIQVLDLPALKRFRAVR